MSMFIAPLNEDAGGTPTAAKVIGTVANPTAAPVLSLTSDAGATLQLVKYYVAFSWVTPYGETLVSPSATITATALNDITVTIPALPVGATAANVYMSELPNNLLLQGNTATTTYVQATAIVNSLVNPSTFNTTGQWVTGVRTAPADTVLVGTKALTVAGIAIASSTAITEVYISADAAILIGNAAAQVLAIPANTNFGPLKVSNLALIFAKTATGTGNLSYLATV